jgi:hypothetical protein
MNSTVIPRDMKERFVIVDGFFIEPHHIHSTDAHGVTLKDGRRFER